MTSSKSVQLTKIHYYSNVVIPTISREVFESDYNSSSSSVIKKNIFGHKWVLKINDGHGGNVKKTPNLWYYVIVFTCIAIAVGFGLFFTLEKHLKHNKSRESNSTRFDRTNDTLDYDDDDVTLMKNDTKHKEAMKSSPTLPSFCKCQDDGYICLKLTENDKPQCRLPIDFKDPTGCGGYYVKNILKCPNDTFNCGNRCISLSKRCDGIVNCSNKSDENNCYCDISTHFQCGNMTSCLPRWKKCDGNVDCWDKSDEIGCDVIARCPDLPKSKFCDGFVDCPDQSDEPQGCQR